MTATHLGRESERERRAFQIPWEPPSCCLQAGQVEQVGGNAACAASGVTALELGVPLAEAWEAMNWIAYSDSAAASSGPACPSERASMALNPAVGGFSDVSAPRWTLAQRQPLPKTEGDVMRSPGKLTSHVRHNVIGYIALFFALTALRTPPERH